MPAQTVIKVRRDTAANWTFADPTLASGEIGFETDTNQIKIGNGTDAWTALDYTSGGASVEISETAPAEPNEGNVWFNSTDGRAYIYYDSTWVDLNPGIAGPQGTSGITYSTTAPVNTNVLWLDTDEEPDVPVPAGGATGQILAKVSATDYDTAWVPQNVRVFADAAARSAAIPSPTEGMYAHLNDTDELTYYDGSAWVNRIPTPPTPAWVDYTPTLTNLTLGNGTITARYAVTGKVLFVTITVTRGSTTSFGNTPQMSLPSGITTPHPVDFAAGVGSSNSVVGNRYLFRTILRSSSTLAVAAENAASTYSRLTYITNTIPATWEAGDAFVINATLEID